MLQTSLRNVLPSDTGAAAAAGSVANQLGSSIGAALLNTIAATATTAYVVAHKGATAVTAADHGFVKTPSSSTVNSSCSPLPL